MKDIYVYAPAGVEQEEEVLATIRSMRKRIVGQVVININEKNYRLDDNISLIVVGEIRNRSNIYIIALPDYNKSVKAMTDAGINLLNIVLFERASNFFMAFDPIYHLFDHAVVTYTLQGYARPTYINLYEAASDYVRYSTLDMIIDRIKDHAILGNIAEVGVFQGTFISKVNNAFPDKKVYLFDTFESFDEGQMEDDRSLSTATKDGLEKMFTQFKDTSVELVLKNMIYPNQCIVKKGLFPQTAQDVDDTFCFVSLDTDLYQPTIDGLNFFYPRLSENGFIMIHDYNNSRTLGVKHAVEEWCFNNKIYPLAIADQWGSVVFVKTGEKEQLSEMLAKAEAIIAEKEVAVAKAEAVIEACFAENMCLSEENKKLEENVELQKKKSMEVENSMSWKITSPLRKILDFLR